MQNCTTTEYFSYTLNPVAFVARVSSLQDLYPQGAADQPCCSPYLHICRCIYLHTCNIHEYIYIYMYIITYVHKPNTNQYAYVYREYILEHIQAASKLALARPSSASSRSATSARPHCAQLRSSGGQLLRAAPTPGKKHRVHVVHVVSATSLDKYPPTPAGAAPRSSVHVCSPLSTTRPLPFLQIAIGPRLPHPFYCSGISPPPPGTRRSHSAVLGTTSRPRLLDPFHLSGIAMVVE